MNKGGVQRFNGHLYWFSWQDNDPSVAGTKWDWFNARNYCRKRCMDLVSFETREEYEWVKGFINGELLLKYAISYFKLFKVYKEALKQIVTLFN